MKYSGEQLAIIALNLVPEIGPARFARLVSCFGSAEAAMRAAADEICAAIAVSRELAGKISSFLKQVDPAAEVSLSEGNGAKIVTCIDSEYPESLKTINDYPAVLYVQGDTAVFERPSIAIVGTRKITNYGSSVATSFSREFAGCGITVVSGLARGVDTQAHKTAIDAGGSTIAVLGNGLGHFYPPENRKLQEKIPLHGAVVSEFPFNRRPDKIHFPRRNRIISAISRVTVVIEADIKSGALITAKYAAEQGKEVFAVPGQIYSKSAAGTNYLIKSGAHLADSAEEIMDTISEFYEVRKKFRKPVNIKVSEEKGVADGEQKIIGMLDDNAEGVTVDYLAGNLNMNAGELSKNLLMLEIKGLVKSLPGKMYILNR